jgi:uncharacterized membrane protein YdjX (TVP38/TMEM64 family)
MSGKKYVLKYITVGIIIFFMSYFYTRYRNILFSFNLAELRRFILGYGSMASIVFILLYSLKPIFIVIPASLLSVAAGSIYGPLTATSLSIIGCFFSSSLAFFLSKIFGKVFVENIKGGNILKLQDQISKNGFYIILMMRLSVIFPYDALSYAAGLTKIKYSDFILATMVGTLPEIISYSIVGKHLGEPLSVQFILPLASLVVCAFIFTFTFKRMKEKS